MTASVPTERILEDSERTGSASETALQYEFSPNLVTLSDARPSEAEAIRTIRTHIIARHLHDGRRGLTICGPTKGVGCTFTAVNLAVSLAQAGVATLLIDADMRDPHVEDFIRPQKPALGLKQCIGNPDRPIGEFIHPEVLPNLSVLYSGGPADNAQELLTSDPFRRLIERCLRDFEFTIVDTPPTNGVADALRVGSLLGYSVIVAKAHTTLASELAYLADQLQADGSRVVGTVLNET